MKNLKYTVYIIYLRKKIIILYNRDNNIRTFQLRYMLMWCVLNRTINTDRSMQERRREWESEKQFGINVLTEITMPTPSTCICSIQNIKSKQLIRICKQIQLKFNELKRTVCGWFQSLKPVPTHTHKHIYYCVILYCKCIN